MPALMIVPSHKSMRNSLARSSAYQPADLSLGAWRLCKNMHSLQFAELPVAGAAEKEDERQKDEEVAAEN